MGGWVTGSEHVDTDAQKEEGEKRRTTACTTSIQIDRVLCVLLVSFASYRFLSNLPPREVGVSVSFYSLCTLSESTGKEKHTHIHTSTREEGVGVERERKKRERVIEMVNKTHCPSTTRVKRESVCVRVARE